MQNIHRIVSPISMRQIAHFKRQTAQTRNKPDFENERHDNNFLAGISV